MELEFPFKTGLGLAPHGRVEAVDHGAAIGVILLRRWSHAHVADGAPSLRLGVCIADVELHEATMPSRGVGDKQLEREVVDGVGCALCPRR